MTFTGHSNYGYESIIKITFVWHVHSLTKNSKKN